MVLSQSEVAAKFPWLELDPDETGFIDSDAAAENTIDPADSGPDLEAQGHLDGYQNTFFNVLAILGAAQGGERLFSVISVVDLFDSTESARAYLKQQLEDIRIFRGEQIGGFAIGEMQELTAPQVGSDARSGQVAAILIEYNIDFNYRFVVWRRGPVVASLVVLAADIKDWTADAQLLALKMDQRIQQVIPFD